MQTFSLQPWFLTNLYLTFINSGNKPLHSVRQYSKRFTHIDSLNLHNNSILQLKKLNHRILPK